MIDPNNIRVYQPTSILFVCGGTIDTSVHPPPSLREAFMRIAHNKPFDKYNPVLAEDLNAFFPQGTYRDLLTLESDIAQISSLILVFSESYGSAAELGAFAVLPEISQRLLVVVDDKRFQENSFIKLGPLLSLQNSVGETSVCVLNRRDIGIEKIDKLENLDVGEFSYVIEHSIKERIRSIPNHSTFNRDNNGHLIKLIVGLIQWYGALTPDEIDVALYCLGITCPRDRILNFLVCADFARWISSAKRGVRTFYVAKAPNMAVRFQAKPGMELDRVRWQAAIRDQWKEKDRTRFNCIAESAGLAKD
nr:retron St85 family effector protein [Ensifer sp. ENS09]